MKRVYCAFIFLTLIVHFSSSQCVIPVIASVDRPVICQGDQVRLSAVVIPATCGASASCSGNNISSTVGSGNINQPGTITQPPTLLGNFNNSGRNEMLYLASELTPALGGPCIIKTISFNLSVFNSASWLENFTVRMGCTNATSINRWDNTLNTFYFSATGIQPASGWGTIITLNTPFAWDGTSNLIVDICWNSFSFGNQNNKAECTNTAFNSYLTLSSNANLCGTSNPPTVSTLRPNIRFNYCFADINDYNVLWTPNTGFNGVADPDTAITTASPTATQSYIINVTDGAGCAGADTVLVQVDNSRVSAGADINDCPGNVNTLSATPIGTLIPGPPSYSWTTLAGINVGNTQNVNVSPVVTTTYIVAMSGGGCIKRDTVTINIGGLTVNATPVNSTCNGYDDGKIFVTSNGTLPLTYLWSVNANTANVDSAINLAPGNYSVTVTDAGGCSGSASASVTQPTSVSFTSAVVNNVCFGNSNGSITISPSGGTGSGYTYQWSNSLPSTPTVNSLAANNYTVTVRDGNLCSATAAIAVTQPTQITFGTPVIQDVRCFNGSTGRITASVSGGTAPYTYSWSHNPGLNSSTASNLPAGSYTLAVQDFNNCLSSAMYVVGQPSAGLTLNAPTITDPSCFGGSNGSATVNPAGGIAPYTYIWNPSSQNTQTATGLSAQVYNVTVTDDSLCTATASIIINQPAQIAISSVISNVRCNGNSDGSIDITLTNAAAPITFNWSNTAITEDIVNIPAGSYSVGVTDNNGCTQSASFTVSEPPVLVMNPPLNVTNVSCFGGNNGSITISVSGGTPAYSYSWSHSIAVTTPTASSLPAGNYTVTATDANLCTVTASYLITEPSTPIAFGNATVTDVLCNGFNTGSITISVSGGAPAYSYSWSHSAAVITPTASSLPAANYTVTVTDANSCTASAAYAVTEPAAITFSAPAVSNASCFGYTDGSIEVFPSGGVGAYSYTWNGTAGNNPQTNLAAGNYNIVVTDANNCSASTSATITEPGVFSVSLTAQDAFCATAPNGSITSTVAGGTPGFFYAWSNGSNTQNVFGLTSGNYSVTVNDVNGCSVSSSAFVGEPAPLQFNAIPTQVKCPGDKNGTITITNASGGTAPYTFSASQDGFSNVFYPNGNNVIENLASGYYAVLFSDNNGCTILDTVFVPSPVPDTFDYTTDSTSCYGAQYSDGAIHAEGLTVQNMPYRFGVDGGPLSFSGDLYNLTAGTHTVNAVNNWGCPSDFTVYVPEPVEGKVNVYPTDTVIQLGESLQLSSSFSPYPASVITSYQWSPAEGLSCIDCWNPLLTTYSRTNEYVLTVNYNGTCVSTATLTVTVQDTLKFFVPNTFSPNGDGNNDKWMVYGEGIKTVDLKIFNRWGEQVFATTNPFDGWDGTYKSEPQNPAVFVYNISVTFLNDRKTERVGSIMLLK